MIQHQLKLRLTSAQEAHLDDWLWQCTGLFNWAVRKIELDAKGGVFYTRQGFQNLLAGHSRNMGMPSHTMQAMLTQAYIGWQRCFKKIAKKPRLKGVRNKLNSIPFPDPIKTPVQNRVRVPGLGLIRLHKQSITNGKYSTMTCSACGAQFGPTGVAGLRVRHWTCGCGTEHNRDINAAINTLNAAVGSTVELRHAA